ncbi:MAG: NUDIX domain-containing protein [Lachnospiraceae bacterium]|nr:NUDIX domain-containing protein [Lachnospiraceae bacterium]
MVAFGFLFFFIGVIFLYLYRNAKPKKIEKSCGAIVYTRRNGVFYYLLVREKRGTYSFPKGHMEEGETEHQTALREIREETGLELSLESNFRMTEEYPLRKKPGTVKKVVYFLANMGDLEPHTLVPEEIVEIKLVPIEEAAGLLEYQNKIDLLEEVHQRLLKKYL